MEKRKLTVEEQVAHLKSKGVQFMIMDEAAAMTYLRKNSNYFKVASYRKIINSIQAVRKWASMCGWSLLILLT